MNRMEAGVIIGYLILQEALERIQSLQGIDELNSLLFSLRSMLGVVNIAYHGSLMPGRIAETDLLSVTYEESWQRRYADENYLQIDPVEAVARAIERPIDWNELKYSSIEAQAFFSEAERHGVGHNGLSIPLTHREAGKALFSVTSNLRGKDWEQFKDTSLPALLDVGSAIQQKTLQLEAKRALGGVQIAVLTAREQDILSLYVNGYEVKEIRHMRSVSDTAVRDALNSVVEKLGARGPRHAGYVAMALGLVYPNFTPKG